MVNQALDPFVTYYQRELSFLRRASTEFAQQYSKIARRLELGPTESADPHVERLLESFAFLTASLQRDIDDKFPRITSALLGVLYPQFVNPIPAISIAKFDVDPTKGVHTSGHRIDRGTELFSRAVEGEICKFHTCYPVELWPLEVTKAEIIPIDTLTINFPQAKTARILRLRISALTNDIKQLSLDHLRFYIHGDRAVQNALYEIIFTRDPEVWLVANAGEAKDTKKLTAQKAGQTTPVGFAADEEVIQCPPASHPAYRLLFEYFNCPQKFFFFDIDGLNTSECKKSFDLCIAVPDNIGTSKITFDHHNFRLGCTPIINLFQIISEPLRLDHKTHDYRLVANYRRDKTTEIHSVKEMTVAFEGKAETQTLAPYFSFNHHEIQRDQRLFWYARRQRSITEGTPGTDMYLSFVDFDFNPKRPPSEIIYGKVLCTNRHLASQVPQGAILESETGVPANISCLEKPSNQSYPPEEGETQWRLISQLSLNHLSLASGDQRLKSLKEMLQLYANLTQNQVIEEIRAIEAMTSEAVTRRFRSEAWRGFAEGNHIELTFREESFGGGGTLLFASVLNEFFALYAAVNSFTELAIRMKGQKEIWKQWPTNAGDKFLL